MNVYEFMAESPILTFFIVFVACLMVESLWKSFWKSRAIIKQGYPPLHCDAEGDKPGWPEAHDNPHVGVSNSSVLLVAEITRERQRQIDKGFGPEWDDEAKTPEEWCNDIEAYIVWARQMHRMRSPDKYRRRMRQIAALAIAACESFDRKSGN